MRFPELSSALSILGTALIGESGPASFPLTSRYDFLQAICDIGSFWIEKRESCKPDDFNPLGKKPLVSQRVFKGSFLVLLAVEFDGKSGFRAVEVQAVTTDRDLSFEFKA